MRHLSVNTQGNLPRLQGPVRRLETEAYSGPRFSAEPFTKIRRPENGIRRYGYDYEWTPKGTDLHFIVEQAGPQGQYTASLEIGYGLDRQRMMLETQAGFQSLINKCIAVYNMLAPKYGLETIEK